MFKAKDNKNILKTAREKQLITYRLNDTINSRLLTRNDEVQRVVGAKRKKK